MTSTLSYPLYLIASDQGVLVATTRGKDCVMLFHYNRIAERHISESNVFANLYPLAIPSEDALRQGLKSLPNGVSCAIWDATVAPSTFVYMDLNELFLAIAEG